MTNVPSTNDAVIRSALHRQRLRRQKSSPSTIVVDELGLAHARSRVDVAVINGCIHGYEIKSHLDTLERLPRQIAIYRETLQKLTIVAATKHVDRVIAKVPTWCGVLEAEQGPRGGILFNSIQHAKTNPDADPFMLAHLLWRDEAVKLLSKFDYTPSELRRPRKQLYEMLAEVLTLREITASIKEFMIDRQEWRDHPQHA